MEKQARSKLFNILIAIFIAVGSGYLVAECEYISLGWLVVFMLMWTASVFVLDYYRKKEFKATLEQLIEGVVVELRGGAYDRKKSFWISLLVSLAFIFYGAVSSTSHVNVRVSILMMGIFVLLIGIFEFLSLKKNPQIRLVLLEDKLLLFEAPNKEETIMMKDFRYCVFEEKKIYILSEGQNTVTADSRNFEEEEFAEFKARLQSVTDYWLKKNEQQLTYYP